MATSAVPYAVGPYASPLLGVSWSEFALALILLVARIYNARTITHFVRLDLYLAVLTFLLASLSLAFFTVSVCYGLGANNHDITDSQEVLALKWAWPNTAISLFAISGGKLSFIAFLQQLHSHADHGKVAFLWCLGISNLIINAITVGMIFTSCHPVAKLWDSALPGNCDGMQRNQDCAFFQGSWSAMVDLILASYPAFFFYRVKLERMVKISLVGLMSLGVVACACAIVKTVKLSSLSNTTDVTYSIGQLDIWNTTEMWVILIAANIPPLRPLMVNLLQKAGISVLHRTATDQPDNELRSGPTFSGANHTSGNRHSLRGDLVLSQGESQENIIQRDAITVKSSHTDAELSPTVTSTEAKDDQNAHK